MIVTLTTDFGEADPYVASMKGVILHRCPEAQVVDVTHAVEPGDLAGAALVLEEARRWFPPGSVHVAVVDPGVGTERRALAVQAGSQFLVGPDNGLLWPAIAAERQPKIRSIEFRPEEVSPTFHGRDVFAPAAARLAAGTPLARLGPPAADPVRLEGYACTRRGGRLEGAVLRVDRFGNLVTSITRRDLDEAFEGVPFPTLDIRVGGRRIDETATTYGRARPAIPFALIGSGERLEIAVQAESAAKRLRVSRGVEVTVERRGGRR